MEPWALAGIGVLIFLVAALYSSVGHGGASGYLAVLSFFLFAPKEMATAALVLNTLVAGTSALTYRRAGHFSFRLLWPFAVSSVPAALAGGLARISPQSYAFLLAAALFVAAMRMALVVGPRGQAMGSKAPSLTVALPTGGAIGLLSGIVGIGGGIFLSPLMLLLRWADAKQTAAVSAVFIVINSLSGLIGRALGGNFQIGSLALLVPFAFAGGLVGSYFGAWRFSGIVLRRLLAVALVVAGVKLVLLAL